MDAAESIINYVFIDRAPLQQSLRVAGAPRALGEGNKSLANVGDAIIRTIMSVDCYYECLTIGAVQFHETMIMFILTIDDTGATTHHIQILANNARFAQLCDNSGITGCISNNPSQFNVVSNNTKATTLEAVVGAVFLDAGTRSLQEAKRVILALSIIQVTLLKPSTLFSYHKAQHRTGVG
ncbi:hypothetical protein F5X97DRAFT_340958 [Nemania serpens]|nr:hypothetical protein F5X97DRAFT_340958 [Nemania serpens]